MRPREGKVSYRQVWVGVFLAALAPAATLPSVAARFGPWGWLGVAAVIPLGLVWLWAVRGLGGAGLATVFKRQWGVLGSCVSAAYYLWAMGLAALTAGSCVDRLGRTDYGEIPGWLAAVLLGLVAAYLIYKGNGGFLRAVQVFFLALAAALALFFLLGAANLDAANLYPAGGEEAARGLGAVWPAAATLSVGALGMFLPHAPRKAGERPGWRWLTLWGLAAAGICALVIGTLGAELTAKAPLPFFLALQGIGFPGAFQRLEAAGTAAWVLSDLALVGLAALAAVEITGKRGGAWPVLLAAVAGGVWLPNAVVAEAQDWLFAVNILLGGGLPILAAATRRVREAAAGP